MNDMRREEGRREEGEEEMADIPEGSERTPAPTHALMRLMVDVDMELLGVGGVGGWGGELSAGEEEEEHERDHAVAWCDIVAGSGLIVAGNGLKGDKRRASEGHTRREATREARSRPTVALPRDIRAANINGQKTKLSACEWKDEREVRHANKQ